MPRKSLPRHLRKALTRAKEEARDLRPLHVAKREPRYVSMWDCMTPHGKPTLQWQWDWRKHLQAKAIKPGPVQGPQLPS